MSCSSNSIEIKRRTPIMGASPIRQWSHLPLELLEKIVEKDQSNVPRIRSVCKWWNCSIPKPNPYFSHDPLPSPFFVFPFRFLKNDMYDLAVLEVLVVVLRPLNPNNTSNSRGGIVKLMQERSGKLHVMNPLLHRQCAPDRSTKVINLLDYHVQVIQRCHVVRGKCGSERVRKVVVSGNMICAIVYHYDHYGNSSWQLGFLKFGDQSWNRSLRGRFHDVLVYKDKFYAVDNEGLLVMIDPLSLKVLRIVNRRDIVAFNSRKYLVESTGDLFLVVKDDIHIKVYTVDEVQGTWIELLHNLEDRIFFVGDPECSFSILTKDLPPEMCKIWNCVYYKHDEQQGGLTIERACLYDFHNGSNVSLSTCSDAMSIFWNPMHRRWKTIKPTPQVYS